MCRKCEKHIRQAIELKKLLLKSEKYFKEKLDMERYIWHENLRELRATPPATTMNTTVERHKTEIEPPTLEPITDDITDLNENDLEEFIHEAVMTSISEIREIDMVASSPTIILHDDELTRMPFEIKKEPKDLQQDDDVCSMTADTCPCSDTLNDRLETDFDFVDMITDEQIEEMTEMISGILPVDIKGAEKRGKSIKTSKAIRNKRKTKAKPLNPPSNLLKKDELLTLKGKPKELKNREMITQPRRSARRESMLMLKKK